VPEDVMCLTFKIKVPGNLYFILNDLYVKCGQEVIKMIDNREAKSSKDYKNIPCIVAKSLISKYQRNKKLKTVHNLVIPICGDKGKQIKITDNGMRIPALFKKDIIPITFPKPIVGFIRGVEFFKKDHVWYMSYSYNTPIINTDINPDKFMGVDRNSKGNVVAIALPNGNTKLLGPDTASITKNFRNRRAKLQHRRCKQALKQIKRKQSNRIKEVNHKVSRTIVNLAQKHCSAIVLENLGHISKKGKARRYVQKSQWSFYQLETFIKYKAALLGIPVYYVDARYTSQKCNKCGSINKTSGKRYECNCGHVAHRDINAALNIRDKIEQGARCNLTPGLIDDPLNRTIAVIDPESSGGAR
jgi:putative transposase